MIAMSSGEPGKLPSRLVSFNHDPVELLAQLQAGTTDLEDLVFSLPPRAVQARLCWQDDEVQIQVERER
jgi:hypothetical protein